MNKIIKIIVVSLFFISGLLSQCIDGGGVFVNEIYNESGGSTEFVELVVVGDPSSPTDPVDLSGWIVDDNNVAMSGQGTAPGHLILDGSFSSVAPGTIILITSEHFPYSPLPADNAWLIKVEGSDLDGCHDSPNNANSNYSPCGASGGDYNYIIFNNNHDIIQTRQPDETYYHAVVFSAVVEGDVDPYADIDTKSSSLNCGDWFDGSNYEDLPETPGEANSPENANLINAIRNGTLDCDNIIASCADPCPEIDLIEIFNSPVCDDDPFTLKASGLANMGQVANGTQDFGIDFVYFNSPPADPYSGGTSLSTVDYTDFTGTDPDQVAETSIVGGTLTAGTYTICAILLNPPANYDCNPSKCEEIIVNESPEATLEGPLEFCPGDCHEINTLITGGTPEYDVEFTFSLSALGINVTFPIASYEVDNQLNICYSASVLVPEYV